MPRARKATNPAAWLEMTDIFGDLSSNKTYVAAFSHALTTLWSIGTEATLKAYLSGTL